MHPKTRASRSSERTGNGSSFDMYTRIKSRCGYIAATRVAYLAETVIKSHYFVGLESGKLIA